MADVNANIGINIDTSQSLAQIKALQRQLAQLYTGINKGSAAAAAAQKGLATNLMNTVNAGGKFYAQMGTIRTSTESFTHALEKNKLTMREYFRFAGGSTRTFGKLFKSEFDTIGRVAEERVKKMQTQYIKLGRDASGAMKAISITPTTLNMKDYGNQVAVAAQKQALLNQLLRQGSTNLLNFGKNTQWAGRQLMVGFTIPLAYFGTAAAKTFMDLEAQAIKFKRVYGDMFTTTSETQKALSDIESLAKEFTKYGVAVSKTMEMAASAAAMGKTGAELTAQVAQATRLAVLGNVEQEEALKTTISLTNAFGVSAEDLTSKINFLNAVENQTVTAIEDLTIAIPKAGPVVKQLGGDVEDLAFFLTAMKEGGINASEGANALKSGLASLINPSDKAKGMLADLGINIDAIVEGNAGNLKEIVIDFAQALDTLAPLERSRAIEQLFGKFQFARLSTLFENVTKEGTQAARVLDLAGKSVEELAILSERELKTVEDAIGTNFRAAVEELKLAIAPIGKEFLKVITPVIKFFGDLFEKFNNLSDGSKKFIVVLTTLIGLVGPTLLMTFGLLANGAANIIKMFLLMRQGFLKLTGNSTNLAQQTQYLNSEQMEAAIVASSLNQAHTKLTQQFILEAGAVNQLRNAYIQATTAAARFAATNPGMMLPGFKPGIKSGGSAPKFASGTAEVVGGTAGKDSVPALLMPGEAVIPTAIAQDDKFKPLIQALISGEIAQYGDGTAGAGSQSARSNKNTVFFDFDDTLASTKGALGNWMNENGIDKKAQLTQEQYNRFNQDVLSGKVKIPAIDKNIKMLRRMKDAGLDVQILSARVQNDENRKVVRSFLQSNGIQIDDAKINLQPISKIEDVLSKAMIEERDAVFKKNFIDDFSKNKTSRSYLIDDNITNIKAVKELKAKNITTLLSQATDREVEKIKIGDRSFNAKDSKKSKVVKDILQKLQYDSKTRTFTYVDPKDRKRSQTFSSLRLAEVLNTRDAEGQLNWTKVQRSLNMGSGMRGSGISSNKDPKITKLVERGMASTDLYTQEDAFLTKELKKEGIFLAQKQKKEAFRGVAAHLNPLLTYNSEGQKVFDPKNLMADKQFVNNYLQGLNKSTSLKSLLQMDDANFAKTLAISDKEVLQYRKELGRAAVGYHPKTPVAASALAKLATYDYNLNKNPYAFLTAKALEFRLEKGFYGSKTMPFLEKIRRESGKIKGTFAKSDRPTRAAVAAMREKVASIANAKKSKLGFNPATGMQTVLAAENEALRDKRTGQQTPIKEVGVPKSSNERSVPYNPKDKIKVTYDPKVKEVVKPKTTLASAVAAGLVGLRGGGTKGVVKLPGKQNAEVSQSLGIKSGGAPGVTTVSKNIQNLNDEVKNTAKQTKNLGQKFSVGANVFSGLTIAGSFMGGKIGEVSQKLAPLAIGLSTVAMLLPGLKAGILKFGKYLAMHPMVALGLAVAGLVVAAKVLDEKMKKQARAQSNYIDAISATTEKMKRVGEITGEVGASEIMSRRRQGASTNTFSDQLNRAGQQFGTSFLESEVGKEILTNFKDSLAKGGSDSVKQIALELSSYVSDGLMTAEDANSVARSIGISLSDMSIYTNIQGELNSIIGPNGEKLESEPLKVRLQIIQETAGTQQDYLKSLQESFDDSSADQKLQDKLSASAAAMGAQTLETIQAQRDAQAKMYEDQIKSLEAEKLKTSDKEKQLKIDDKIKNLQDQAKIDDQNIAAERQKTLDTLISTYKTIKAEGPLLGPSREEKALFASAQEQVRIKFKDDPFTESIMKTLSDLKGAGSEELELKLLASMGAGDMNPMQVTNLLKLYNSDVDAVTKVLNTKIAMENPDKFAQLQNLVGNLKGKNAKSVGIDIIAELTAEGGEEKFNERLATIDLLSKFDGKEIDLAAVIKTKGFEGPGGLDELGNKLSEIEKLSNVTEKTVVAKLKTIGMDAKGIQGISENWDYFSKLPDTLRKQAIQVYTALYETLFKDEASRLAFYAQYKTGGDRTAAGHLAGLEGGKRDIEYTVQATKTIIGEGKGKNKIPGDGTLGDDLGGKDRDTTLDNLLNRLKFIRKASIDAAGGLDELMRIAKGKGLANFGGAMQQLMAGPKGGFNREFISFLEGMDDATRKTYMTIKNGQVVLTKQGRALKEAFNEKVIGDYQVAQFQATQDTKAQFAALQKLKAAGVDSATALEMVSDANLAVAINSKNISSKELNQMAKDAEKAAKAQDRFNLALEASKSVKELKTLEKTARVLSALQKMPGISKAALDRVAQSPKLMEALYNQIFNGAKKSAQDINTLLDNAAKERTASFKIQMVGDPVGAIQGAIQAALGQAQSVMQAAITARTNQISAPFLNKIAPLQRKIATVKGSPEMLAAQATVREAQGKIKVQQGKVDQLNASMSKIDSQIAGYQEQIQNILANATKQYDDKIDSLNAEIDSMQRKVELDFNKPIEDLQRQIESIEKAVEQQFARRIEDLSEALNDLEREMEVNFARPIEQLQIESGFLSDELSYIDNIADKVNQKYDTQKQELEKIASLNQEIAQSQKQQLDLADAITKGDISAAARAVQEIRAQAAANAAGAQGNILDAARNAELRGIRSLKGRTRKQIEDRQKAIEDQINEIENARYAFEIEKDVLGIKDQIYSLEEKRKDALLAIRPIQDRINELEKNRLPYLIAIEAKERDLLILEGQREAAIAKVQGEVKRIEGEISRLEGDKNKLVGQIKDAEKTLNDLQTAPALVAAEATVDKLNTEIEDLEAQIAAIQAEMDAAIANDNTLNKLIDDLRNMENAMNAAFLKGLEKTTEIKNALVLAGGAAKIAAAAVADLFKAAEGELPVFGSAAKAKDTDAASRMQAYKNSLNALSGESKGGNATSTAIGKIAESLKDAKTPAEAVAKATDAIGKSVGSFTPKIKDSVDYLKSQAESLTTMKDAYDLIVDFVLDISPELVKHSASIGSAAGSLKPQPGWWESIKTSISNAVTSAGLYANALSAPLTKAQGIASAIASLNQTVVTTHIIETIVKDQQQNATGKMFGGSIKGYMGGGKVKPIYRPMGGLIPYMSNGGFKPMGSDTVPAMLTPGEFVVNRASAEKFGPLLSLINDTKYPSSLARKFKNQDGANIVGSFNSPEYSLLSPNNSSFIQPVYNVSNSAAMSAPYTDNSQSISNNMNTVYNYNVGINVGGTNVDPKNIARAVMSEIKYIDSQRIRGQRA